MMEERAQKRFCATLAEIYEKMAPMASVIPEDDLDLLYNHRQSLYDEGWDS